MKITYRCETCGGKDLFKLADMVWNVEEQKWILREIAETGFCQKCGSVEFVECSE